LPPRLAEPRRAAFTIVGDAVRRQDTVGKKMKFR
jgi:hypothetical protein